jgi:hypothetical protein
MHRNLSVALALVAGLLGGLLTRYIAPPVALAQDQTPITKEIRAQSFTLVDQSDHTVGTFTVEERTMPSRPTRIVLRDANGREMWSAGGSAFRPLAQR